MSIIFNENSKIFTLLTKNTTYQMKVGSFGFLLHLYYGKRIENDEMDYLIHSRDRGFSGNPYEAENDRGFSLDTLPQEFSTTGVGDYRTNCVSYRNQDGTSTGDFRFVSYKIRKGKYQVEGMPSLYEESVGDAKTLEIILMDLVTKMTVTLYYGVFEENDIITRAVKITNRGQGMVKLEKALSACLELSYGEWELIHFHGRHAMEREFERVPLIHGIQNISSQRGTSSHHHNPFIILCEKEANEEYGSCYGMSLIYSGNFMANIELDQIQQVRAVMGINSEQFGFSLEKDESFWTPEVVLTYSNKGFGTLSRNYHRIYRHNLCRGNYKFKRRPILINNWEATYFDFNSEKLISIAKDAGELGIEMLVMDDGWFGKRDNDFCSLGDWMVNTSKIRGGLKSLVEEVNKVGLKFGIWFEPEMISEDSDLYREHPDWALQIPGRKPNRSRCQLVLDMSREDVREYLFKRISKILDSANIEYVKWDMNRSICDLYSYGLSKERQNELSHRYVLGLYDLLEKITNKYPEILLEGCSGGGGRFDPGMLYYSPQIWCSDNTDAIERIKIQYGTSYAYPISSMGAHVSAAPNHQTGRVTPLETRGVVAMAGSFGYELDLNQLSYEEKEIVKQQIVDFKKYYKLIHEGEYYRLTNPYENSIFTAWQFVSEDKKESLINVVVTHAMANPPNIHVLLKGLDPLKNYKMNGEEKSYSGSALMYGGIVVPPLWGEYSAIQFNLTS